MIPRPNLEQVWIWFGIIAAVAVVEANTISVINYPDSGQASLTRYDYPLNYVGPCSCNTTQSSFPSAALSAAAYGSSIGSGPGCGRCFNLTLLHSLVSIPVYDLAGGGPSIVVRIEDKCPSPVNTDPGMTWCGATSTAHNMFEFFLFPPLLNLLWCLPRQISSGHSCYCTISRAGVDLHFDVASPSIGVPTSFFPVPSANYGRPLSLFLDSIPGRVLNRVRQQATITLAPFSWIIPSLAANSGLDSTPPRNTLLLLQQMHHPHVVRWIQVVSRNSLPFTFARVDLSAVNWSFFSFPQLPIPFVLPPHL